MKQKLTILFAATMLVTLVACGKKDDQSPPARLVKVLEFGQAASPGSQLASKDVLSFDTSGQVIEVLVAAGAKVQAGQALARLIPSSLSVSESAAMASYKAAKAELSAAEADYQRFRDLRAKNFISASEFDRRTAAIEGARAKYEQTLDQLGFVTLRAPEAGTLKTFSIQLRDAIEAKKTVGRLDFSIAKGAPTKSASTKTIPLTAVLSDGKTVYRVKLDAGSQDAGVIEAVNIQVGKATESGIEVLDGLQAGDKVVATGWHALDVGQKVRIALTAKAQ